MLIQLIRANKKIFNSFGLFYCDIPALYAGRQGDRIAVGATSMEVIHKLCAHPDSWLAKMGKPIEEFSDKQLEDIAKGNYKITDFGIDWGINNQPKP